MEAPDRTGRKGDELVAVFLLKNVTHSEVTLHWHEAPGIMSICGTTSVHLLLVVWIGNVKQMAELAVICQLCVAYRLALWTSEPGDCR